jgi:spermidine synthase
MNSPAQSDVRHLLLLRSVLYVLFILSGAAGIIYELLWARYLGLFVGHTAYAQILVLAIFLGGMSVGALFVGSRSEHFRDPLTWYIRVELLIGLMGFAFHALFNFVTEFSYSSLFPALGNSIALVGAKWTISALLILPQSILLGATFPLMSAGVLRRFHVRPGRTLSILYFTNSFGAAAGVLMAGFWLLSLVGLPGTLSVAATTNLLVALVALVALIATRGDVKPSSGESEPLSLEPWEGDTSIHLTPFLRHVMVGVAFGTAVASFIYEIGWIRMLSLVFGSATHSFELMLSAFILGLALGSIWVRKHADRWKNPVRVLGMLQWAMGAAALATLPLYMASFDWMTYLMRMFTKSNTGYTGFNMARYGIGLIIMLPATFCAGTTLPLITRILFTGGVGERAIGRVYGVNTLGSIFGVGIAGLLLMPWIGLKAMLVMGATLDMALGVLVFFSLSSLQTRARQLAFGSVAATVVLAGLGLFSKTFDQGILSSGVFRHGSVPLSRERKTLFYRDGRTSTVSVHRDTETRLLVISTNGKPEASLPAYWFEQCSAEQAKQELEEDAATQLLSAVIPLAYVPDARTAAVIGQGSGMTSHFLLGSPTIKKVVTVEIEPNMIHGSRAFYPANRRVFDDSRSKIVIDDAKSFFAASNQRFDYILSVPSNPWVSGVSSLFTTEFYQRISQYLSDDGIFVQWLQLYEINDQLVLSIFAALHATFPSYVVYQSTSTDIVIVASNKPQLPRPNWSVFQLPAIAKDLCHNFPFTPRMLDAARLLDRKALAPLLDDWPQRNSDFYPILDLGAERARYLAREAKGFTDLSSARFHITAPFFGWVSPPTDETIAPVPSIWRMRALAISAQLRDPNARPLPLKQGLDPILLPIRFLMSRWRALLSQEKAPGDWKPWLEEMRVAEANFHGGLLGFADEKFYERVWNFLDRVGAPKVVRDVVSFRHGLAAWDFREASQAGDGLHKSILERKGYIPVNEYLDGMVVAKLRLGDVASARNIFNSVVPLSRREPSDLRLLLLDAYIKRAESRKK